VEDAVDRAGHFTFAIGLPIIPPMSRPAVFFDRDNTLIACNEYLGDPSQVKLVDGAADAIARARKLGYATIIFSNQSGVARGYFSEEAVHAVNARLDEMLRDANAAATIDRHEFCPFHPDASIEKYRKESPLRKPGAGMIHSAAEALDLDLSQSWVIGDAPRDVEAGHAAGCRTILFTDASLKSSPAAGAERKVEPDYVCSTLKDAMEFIAENTPDAPKEEASTPSPLEGEGGGEGKNMDEPTAVDRADLEEPRTEPVPTTTLPPHPSPPPQGGRGPENAPATPKLETLAADILHELRRRHEQPVADFSVSKLFAGVVQVVVLAVLFMSFLNRGDSATLIALLMFAMTLQAMTIALLIMGRQR
jgi:D-glycero-D-manno-heptose 1,7-bisphosphate phosphatase